MINIFFTLFFLIQALPSFGGVVETAEAIQKSYPLGGVTVRETQSGITVEFQADFYQNGYTQPSQAQIDSIVADYMSLLNVRARRLAEIQAQAMSLYNQYALYSTVQSVLDYGAALRSIPTTAQTEMAALPDVASVKNYQPTWPTKPNL